MKRKSYKVLDITKKRNITKFDKPNYEYTRTLFEKSVLLVVFLSKIFLEDESFHFRKFVKSRVVEW